MDEKTQEVEIPQADLAKTLTYTYIKDGQEVKKDLFSVIDKDKDIWVTGSRRLKIIGLEGIKKIMEAEGICEKQFRTEVTPKADNKQQHCVNIWVGLKGDKDSDNWSRGSGEASQLNTGEIVRDSKGVRTYSEMTKIDSRYRFAMADKRALCRAVLNFIHLYGVYSEVEASEFADKKDSVKDFDY